MKTDHFVYRWPIHQIKKKVLSYILEMKLSLPLTYVTSSKHDFKEKCKAKDLI